MRNQALLWARGRSWAWRALIVLYVAYAGFRHLADPDYRSIFSGITFGVHELGHLVFAFFGSFLAVAGGTIAQLALPIAAGALLWSHRDYFGVAVAGGWLSMSLAEMAVYMADAREQSLTLLGFGPDPEHDWHYLLSAMGLLEPIAAGALLWSHRDYFGVAVAGGWLSMSLAEMAVYMADAREQSLTLLGFGPDPEHDWHYLLSAMGLLEQDRALADLARLAALIVLTSSLVVGAWLCVAMAQSRRTGEGARSA